MNREVYKKYAEVLVKIGVNLQKGQDVIIDAPIEAYELVREISKLCYNMGAKFVKTDFFDDYEKKIKAEYCEEEYLTYYPKWQSDYLKAYITEDVRIIYLRTVNPKIIEQVSDKRQQLFQKGILECKKAQADMTRKISVDWTIAYYPTVEWAKYVYPELNEELSFKRLWEDVISINMLCNDDPVLAWENHKIKTACHRDTLEAMDIQKLHFKSENTNLTMNLAKGNFWVGGYYTNDQNEEIVPNIPTVEVFTTPSRLSVNGFVSATLPLNYNDTIIENIKLFFENGKIIKYESTSGFDVLKTLIETDEGSHYLGEVALVSADSPIFKTGRIFYNTIFDENAVCHIAIGNAYASYVFGAASLNDTEKKEAGINVSLKHVDLMIGSDKIEVTATLPNGEEKCILKNGMWVI